MDFVRLAVRDVRRNGSRTALAVAATALATVILVLSRLVPEGYLKYQAYAERSFAGADILVWKAPAHVYSKDSSPLEWRAWTGEEWQSFAEYFIPTLPTQGYVSPVDAPEWGPLDVRTLSPLTSGVEGVHDVSPYLSLPCKVKVGDGYVDAVLRGREPGGPGEPLSMAWQVKTGRPLGPEDEGGPSALFPLMSEPRIPYPSGARLELLLPRLEAGGAGETGASGRPDPIPPRLSWDLPVTVSLEAVGGYQVELGLVPEENEDAEVVPSGFWKRPEIVVSQKTFMDLAAGAAAAPGQGVAAPEPPVYQMLVRVSRHSETKKVVERLRENLGPGYAVHAVAELVSIRSAGGGQRLITPDMSALTRWMIITMSAAIVAASVYVLLALQTSKIGLLRAIGATSRNVALYALAAVAYVSLLGIAIGFILGKLVALTVVAATDFTLLEWLTMAGYDAILSLSGMAIPLALGLAVAVWASRIPCAEVLRRE
jgi:hypothetical protein